MFVDRLEKLMKENGVNRSFIAKQLGCRPSLVSNWFKLSETNHDFLPTADAVKGLAEYFHVSSNYLYGLEDEYGLNNQDWYVIASLIGDWLTAIRHDCQWLFKEAEIDGVSAESFENGLSPLKAEQLEKIGEVCRIPDIKLYLPAVYALKLWPEMQKVAPDTGDDLNDAQRRFVQLMSDLTPEEAVAAVAYIQGLRDKQSRL